jgi:hypothetical protein
MSFSQIVAAVTAFVTGLVPLSCQHRTSSSKSGSPLPTAHADGTTNSIDATNSLSKGLGNELGDVALTNHYERCVQLGGGRECIFYPHMVDKNNAEITVTFKSKLSTGQVHDMIVTRIDVKNGEPTEVTLGDLQLNLTPDIVSE